MAKLSPAKLRALQASLTPKTWELRVRRAEEHAAVVQAIDALRSGGATEDEALAQVAPDWHPSTYHGRRRRYQAAGLEGLINKRPGSLPDKVTPEVRQAICMARRIDPQVPSERIIDAIWAQFGVRLGNSTVLAVLQKAGLSRLQGGGIRKAPEPEELEFGGAVFLQLTDQELGYSKAVTETILEVARNAPEPDPDRLVPDDEGRDENGRFMAAYNARRAKEDPHGLGPAFRSVGEKRRETDLRERRAAQESPETIERKVKVLLALPLLTDAGKTIEVSDWRGSRGVAEFAGMTYTGETLERFWRDLKYLGAADPLAEAHARFWIAREPAVAGSSPAALQIYVDGSSKPLWTSKFTKCGKVSATGRVQPCLDMVVVNTGAGTPIFFQTFSGHASLVKQTVSLLDKLEAQVGEGWMADKLTVIDREASSAGLLKEFDARGRDLVTMLRDGQAKVGEVEELSAWEPYDGGREEIADGFAWLNDSHEKDAPYRARVVLLRRPDGETTVLASTARREAPLPDDGGGNDAAPDEVVPPGRPSYTGRELADGYFLRWQRQELRFRAVNQATQFKRNFGYGKKLVLNATVLTELDKARCHRDRLVERIARREAGLLKARETLGVAKLRVNAAKARQARQDGLVDKELAAKRTDRQALQARVETAKAERSRKDEALTGVVQAEKRVAEEESWLQRDEKRLPKLDAEIRDLESRKEIYQADTEMDRIATAFKLGFVLICEHMLREFFGGMRLSLPGLMRQILSLPGTRTIEGNVEHIRLRASPNKAIMAAVEAACERVNAREIVRNGRVVRLSVDWPDEARKRGEIGKS
ncbi:MAG: hypothetical protein KGJ86_12035 [Chloroflexota bacterium]|nr:hypothetical protein [Chloroflexota bacterium]